MKAKLFFIVLFSIVVEAQTGTKILFEDGFESYDDFAIANIGDWIVWDLDERITFTGIDGANWNHRTTPQAFIVFNPLVAGVTNRSGPDWSQNFDPKTGLKYVGSWGAVPLPVFLGGMITNNDWIISPKIELGASANEVSFWVKSLSDSVGLESYRVGVYSGSDAPVNPSDFSIISGQDPLIAPFNDWEEKVFNLDDYANQIIRVGINCVSEDKLFFMVDDFKVTAADLEALRTKDFLAENLSIFPNPAHTVLNIAVKKEVEVKNVRITDPSGRIVKSLIEQKMPEFQVNIIDLKAGMYFVSVLTNDGTVTSRFLKK